MLLSFRFANHRSFRDEQHLNLVPVYETRGAETLFGREAVPVAGVFGANASGKSNVISALSYMSRLVGVSDRETEPGLGLKRQPFRLDPAVAVQPSSYAVDLTLGGVRHTYGFTLNDEQVLEEWLYTYPLRRKRVLFERADQDFSWGEDSGRSALRQLAEIVAPTALFLSVAARFVRLSARDSSGDSDNISDSLHNVYSWLYQRMLRVSPPMGGLQNFALNYSRLLTNDRRRAVVVEILRAADVGLRDVSLRPPDEEELLAQFGGNPEDLPPAERERLRRLSRRDAQLQFLHYGAAGDVVLDVADESSGTLRILELAARAVSVLERGGLFVIDEVDASLHPLLTARLIGMFELESVNSRAAQLIFTSHDATLLGSLDGEEILRRDQIWFTEKDDYGCSSLFPLAEFKPKRAGENRVRRYLNGNYGAIPDISMSLFEQALSTRIDVDAE